MIEEHTIPVHEDETTTEPLWGQAFFFDFNPLGTLDITLTNEQFLMSEEIGKVRITVRLQAYVFLRMLGVLRANTS